jgi:DNA-binding beta-propeller fold protein YncE
MYGGGRRTTGRRHTRHPFAWLAVTLLVVAVLAPGGSASAASRAVGDTRVFAKVPDPGQPAGIAVDGRRVLVSTAGALQPSADPRLFSYDLGSGRLLRADTIPRAMSPTIMALMGIAVDADGKAYVVDMNGRIVRVDPRTGRQDVYATFPGAVDGLSTMPFDIAFDDSGYAYVTDQNLAAIWRVPPGGGEPQIWFQDPRLVGYFFGAAGIRLDPSRRYVYFTVAVSQYPATAGSGLVYRLPLVEHPSADDLQEVFRYPRGSQPFGLAFGASGKLYVALAGPDQVSILRPADGARMEEALRFPSSEENQRRDVPFEDPIGIAFNGTGSLLVTNSGAFSPPNPAESVVFDSYVNDTAAPLARPAIPSGG